MFGLLRYIQNGGNINKPLTNKQYYSIMEKVAHDNWKTWGDKSEDAALTRILNDNSYDYRGYYNKYPDSRANASTHWSDEFKSAYHPTFSNESIYSGQKSKWNPQGLYGGIWGGDVYTPLDNKHKVQYSKFYPRYADGGNVGNKTKDNKQNNPESWLVDMTNVGLGAEKRPDYQIIQPTPLNETVVTAPKPTADRPETAKRLQNYQDLVNAGYSSATAANVANHGYYSDNDKLGFYRYIVNPPLQAMSYPVGKVMKYAPDWVQKGATLLSPSRDLGAIASRKAPWNPENPGIFGNDEEGEALNTMFDIASAPIIGKSIREGSVLANNIKDYNALKSFNNKYGYTDIRPKRSIVFNDQKLDKVFDHTVKRHRTFIRGVDPYETQKFGRLTDMTPEEAAKYSLTHIPKVYSGNNAGLLDGENGLYLSNDFGTAAGYTNGNGYVGIVRMPVKYGANTRRQFLKDNDFVFSRPPEGGKFYWTTDDPGIVKKGRRYHPVKQADWKASGQPNEVRANAGATRIRNGSRDPDFRHYIIVGDVGEQPVELVNMYKSTTEGHKGHFGTGAIGLSRKK